MKLYQQIPTLGLFFKRGSMHAHFLRLISIAILALQLSGCATRNAAPTIETDQFTNNIKINGVEERTNPFGGPSFHWFLRSWIDKQTHKTSHQLYVDVNYLWDWKFFELAANDDAQQLPFIEIARDVLYCSGGGCTFNEVFAASLNDNYLMQKSQSGFKVKFSAHDGSSIVVPVSPNQIQQQIGAIQLVVHPQLAGQINTLINPANTPDQGKLKLGVKALPMSENALSIYGIDKPRGMIVIVVDKDSPAERAGIHVGDLLLEFNGTPLNSEEGVAAAISKMKPGQEFSIQAIHNKKPVTKKGRI